MRDISENRKLDRLKKAGWKTITVQEFLSLSDGDMAVIEVKVALAKRLFEQRKRAGLSQVEVVGTVRTRPVRARRQAHA